MEKIITDEFVAYESGFTDGKSDIIEQVLLDDELPEKIEFEDESWYSKGYNDGYDYYFQEYSKKGYIEEQTISTSFTNKIISEKYTERITSYNQQTGKEIPVSKFRL